MTVWLLLRLEYIISLAIYVYYTTLNTVVSTYPSQPILFDGKQLVVPQNAYCHPLIKIVP